MFSIIDNPWWYFWCLGQEKWHHRQHCRSESLRVRSFSAERFFLHRVMHSNHTIYSVRTNFVAPPEALITIHRAHWSRQIAAKPFQPLRWSAAISARWVVGCQPLPIQIMTIRLPGGLLLFQNVTTGVHREGPTWSKNVRKRLPRGSFLVQNRDEQGSHLSF